MPAAPGVSVAVPLLPSDPLQPVPEDVHEVAPLSDQVNVAEAPRTIELALNDRVGAGGGGGVTVKETVEGGDAPNALLQVRVKVCVVSEVAVNCSEPLVVFEPLHPLPDAVQLVAKLEDQVKIVVPPSVTLVEDSDRDGAGGACPCASTFKATEAVPLAPVLLVQVRV